MYIYVFFFNDMATLCLYHSVSYLLRRHINHHLVQDPDGKDLEVSQAILLFIPREKYPHFSSLSVNNFGQELNVYIIM